MSYPINPYYNPKGLGVELLSFDRPDLSYEYDTFCLWKRDGRIWTAKDSGCSCPVPFEDHCGMDWDAVALTLIEMDSPERAVTFFDEWNKGYDGRKFLTGDEREKILEWCKTNE